MKTPHVHAGLIRAWADGHEIESRRGSASWEICTHPSWYELTEYRVKPEPKPDVVKYATVDNDFSVISLLRAQFDNDNLKLTFDGDTGKLKSAEVIK